MAMMINGVTLNVLGVVEISFPVWNGIQMATMCNMLSFVIKFDL